MGKTITIPTEYKRLFDNDWREAAVFGGRFSLKSHTVARLLLIKAREAKKRMGCFREFQSSIAESSHQLLSELIALYEMRDFEVTNSSIVNTINGSDFIFKGLWNNEQGIKSIEGIDYAWVEEAQTISEKSIEVLTPTVRKPNSKIIYTYNRLLEEDPVHKRLVLEGRPDTLVINNNYDIAIKYKMIPDVILKEIEDDKTKRPALYQHKWLGEPHNMERKIFKDWEVIEEIPHEARLVRRGMDFGYSNDPTVIVDIYEYNQGFIIDEVVHQKGLSNRQIADIIMNRSDSVLCIADSAEPKSIDEIRAYGVNIIGCVKGRDSVKQGIQFVQDQKISVTKRSINTIKCYRNYLWKTDKEDKIINEPEHTFSDPMDCLVKGTLINTDKGDIPIEKIKRGDYVKTRKGFNKVKDSWLVKKNAKVTQIVLSNGYSITATDNHKIWTTKGWKLLTNIKYGDKLMTWKQEESLTARPTTSTQTLKRSHIENISIMEKISCTVWYGKMLMGRFLKTITSTTRTAIHTITGLRISSLCAKRSMVDCRGVTECQSKKNVIVVEKCSTTSTGGVKIDSVQTNVRANGGEITRLTILKRFARRVRNYFCLTSTTSKNVVHAFVVRKEERKKQPVYDITVEKENEYFANGVLVHNSIRYGLSGYKEKKTLTGAKAASNYYKSMDIKKSGAVSARKFYS